jgi:hypothetical protein
MNSALTMCDGVLQIRLPLQNHALNRDRISAIDHGESR